MNLQVIRCPLESGVEHRDRSIQLFFIRQGELGLDLLLSALRLPKKHLNRKRMMLCCGKKKEEKKVSGYKTRIKLVVMASRTPGRCFNYPPNYIVEVP